MKKILIMLMFAAIAAITISAQAQSGDGTQEMNPPGIHSRGEIKTYALEKVTTGNLFIFTEFGETYSVEMTGDSPGEILKNLLNDPFVVKSQRIDQERVSIWVSLRNDDWNSYFSGFLGDIKPQKNKAGEWFIGANLVLNLNDYIPLPIPAELSQITDVKVRLRSDDGYVIAEPYG